MSRANTFDGHNWPTVFHLIASRVIIKNEINEGDPYRLTAPNPKFPKSGYSFGFVQWDLASGNEIGLQVFVRKTKKRGQATFPGASAAARGGGGWTPAPHGARRGVARPLSRRAAGGSRWCGGW